MKLSNTVMLSSAISLGLLLSACDQKKSEPETKTQDTVVEIEQVEKADVLPYLNIQEQPGTKPAGNASPNTALAASTTFPFVLPTSVIMVPSAR